MKSENMNQNLSRSDKRIVCIFRGSVDDTQDWSTNFKLCRTNLDEVKDYERDIGLKEFGDIGLHYGFASKSVE